MSKSLLAIFITLLVTTGVYANEYSFRKYHHVKEFYKETTQKAIDVCLKNNLPPAAVLAISGLESGYGRGYVAQITGNILSLGAFKGDKELPRLYLPYSKSKQKILFDPKEIKSVTKKDDLSWKKRAKSYKRDYRPNPYAGTTKNLDLLICNKNLKSNAHIACFKDFATRWIDKESKIKSFKDTRAWLDNLVKRKGKSILFNINTNMEFIERIGGHSNSFNYRKTWPKKAKVVMKKVGLVKLVDDIYNKKMNFKEAWADNK